MLDSQETARRLGIKLTTLYAYVSRGMLTSYPSVDGRQSLFRLEDVEALTRRGRRGHVVEAKLATVTTGITQIRADGPYYRGRSVCELAATDSFEDVADLLWDTSAAAGWEPVRLPAPPELASGDRLRWSVVLCGALDPFRSDLRPEAVVRTARRAIATAVTALGPNDRPSATSYQKTGIAGRLAGQLTAGSSRELVEAVNGALVLLADHELATSTVAVRVAASTRADIYDAYLAGLGTLGGPLHGGASELAHAMLIRAQREGVEAAVETTLRWQQQLPGFGHTVYREGDPRFHALMELVGRMASAEQRSLVEGIVELAAAHDVSTPNIDLALAALTVAAELPSDAGRVIFSVARMAGWAAHYLEELRERPLRFRARAVYSAGG